MIDAAQRSIPDLLAEVPEKPDGTIELEAAHLVRRLLKAGHSTAAAHWAIHESVLAGRLLTGFVEVETPGVLIPNQNWNGPARVFVRGRRGKKLIPQGRPTPFDCFKVLATDALWTWWRSLDESDAMPRQGKNRTLSMDPQRDIAEHPTSESVKLTNPTIPAIVRSWLTLRYMSIPTPGLYRFCESTGPEPVVFVPFDAFAEFLMNSGIELLPNLDNWARAGWIADVYFEFTLSKNPTNPPPDYIARLNLPLGNHRFIAIRSPVLTAPLQPPPAASADQPPPAAIGEPNNHPSALLLRVFTNGLSDDRIAKSSAILTTQFFSTNEKLTKIDELLPIPPTTSAEKLGELLGVSKQAVIKTKWWTQNRKGEKANEIGRRRAAHKKRAEEHEPHGRGDEDDEL